MKKESTSYTTLDKIVNIHTHKDFITNNFEKMQLKKIFVAEGVFRPDKSFLGKYLSNFLWKNKEIYKNKKVLDIGTGCGIQALICAKHGAKQVVATDITIDSIKNTAINIKINKIQNVSVLTSNLFDNLRGCRFDIIIFNPPAFFSQTKPVIGIEKAIFTNINLMEKFLINLPNHLNSEGFAIIPQSDIYNNKNNPILISRRFGYFYKVLAEESSNLGVKKIIKISTDKP